MVQFQKRSVFLSLNISFVLVYSADPDEMTRSVTFHYDIHSTNISAELRCHLVWDLIKLTVHPMGVKLFIRTHKMRNKVVLKN